MVISTKICPRSSSHQMRSTSMPAGSRSSSWRRPNNFLGYLGYQGIKQSLIFTIFRAELSTKWLICHDISCEIHLNSSILLGPLFEWHFPCQILFESTCRKSWSLRLVRFMCRHGLSDFSNWRPSNMWSCFCSLIFDIYIYTYHI